MSITLDANALAACLAAFIERDRLRTQLAAQAEEIKQIRAELAALGAAPGPGGAGGAQEPPTERTQ